MIYHETSDKQEMFGALPVSDLFLTTANSVVEIDSRQLVMGRGHAKQLWHHFDKDDSLGLRRKLGLGIHELVVENHNNQLYPEVGVTGKPYRKLKKHKSYVCYYAYGVLVLNPWPKKKIGLFQTKDNFNNPSSLELIKFSVNTLRKHIAWMSDALGRAPRVDMPMPGVGAGSLSEYQVRPLLKPLGDNVHIWKLKP